MSRQFIIFPATFETNVFQKIIKIDSEKFVIFFTQNIDTKINHMFS